MKKTSFVFKNIKHYDSLSEFKFDFPHRYKKVPQPECPYLPVRIFPLRKLKNHLSISSNSEWPLSQSEPLTFDTKRFLLLLF